MIAKYLEHLPVEKIWGIGHATTNYLNKMGVRTALEFARLPEYTVRKRFTKPGIETWRNSGGRRCIPSIRKKRAPMPLSARQDLFTPKQRCGLSVCPSDEESGVGLSQGQRLSPGGKTDRGLPEENDFSYTGCEIKLNRPSVYPMELSPELRHIFVDIYRAQDLYRATGLSSWS